ncbi:MAG: GDSL-type esterase/lipase family protein [Pirellulaceae bacterium]
MRPCAPLNPTYPTQCFPLRRARWIWSAIGLVLCLATGRVGLLAAPLRIVALGDSITKGVRTGVTEEQTFSSILSRRLQTEGVQAEVTNVGIGGERTDQALARLQQDVLQRRPHVVLVMYGTNDSYVDTGRSESRLSADQFRSNLLELMSRIRDAGATPVVMTEPAWAEDCRPNGLGEDPNIRLAPFMEQCRRVAREAGVPLVDHYAHWSALAAKGAKLQPWTTDGCHPNPVGHEELANRIVQTLLRRFQHLADEHESWREDVPFRIRLETASEGYDGEKCWVHPRAGVVPSDPPTAVLTTQQLLLTGSDVFFALNDTFSRDGGQTWSRLLEHPSALGRRDEADGTIVAACDFWPKWHAASGKLLGIGHTVRYRDNKVVGNRPRETCYSVWDTSAKTWSPWTTLTLPAEAKFVNAGAGSVQRVDLPNGDILLPIYFRALSDKYYRVTVLRCTFDGNELRMVEQGNELELSAGRGVYEPSLVRWKNRYYLTLRNDTAGYVSVSDDGLHYTAPRRWTWDDGQELENYNTQQHWVPHADALYLVYTRKGAHNDHVFRHRAPLFMAQVDPERLAVLRTTERIVVPERGARLGNFGVTQFGEHETWITVAEWMQTWSPQIVIPPDNSYGANNSIYVARLRWTKPNRDDATGR